MDENENKGLKTYESPSTKKTQVELEGNLCGSTNHTAQSPGTTTTAQESNNPLEKRMNLPMVPGIITYE